MRLLLLVAVLAPFVKLAARVTADPVVSRNSPVTLPIKKHVDKRVQRRDSSSSKGIANVPLTLNNTYGGYSATIGVGNPPTFYELSIDTGSSNTWLGANKEYKKTDTSVETPDGVNITYGSGFMIGTEYNDSVTIAPGVVISGQSIGVASRSFDFYPLDGNLGIGPPGLTLGTLIPNNTKAIPTVTDNLFEQGLINQKVVALSFEPPTSELETNGELTFGGTDSTKFIGDINYVPITDTSPSSEFWGIDASFKYGSATILSTTAGVVDTGTTYFGLATDAFNKYVEATGAVHDNSTGLLRITPAQYNNLESLYFVVGGISYELIPNAQIWPRAFNTDIGGSTDSIYLVVAEYFSYEIGTRDFVVGMVVLERLYSVFDSANQRVGFATTRFTNATTN